VHDHGKPLTVAYSGISRVGYVLRRDDVAAQYRYDQAKCALHTWDLKRHMRLRPYAVAAIQSVLKEL
jgi:hypothetical protein